jgi:hypothetical protein
MVPPWHPHWLPVSTVGRDNTCSPTEWDYVEPQLPLVELPIHTMWVQSAMSAGMRFAGCGGVIGVDESAPFVIARDGSSLNLDVAVASSELSPTRSGHCAQVALGPVTDADSAEFLGRNTLNLQAERE